jgi:hypothetical protein
MREVEARHRPWLNRSTWLLQVAASSQVTTFWTLLLFLRIRHAHQADFWLA